MKYIKCENIKKQVVCIFGAILIAVISTLVIVKTKENEVQRKMAEEVFRFHVLANSDSEEDQALKMEVKEKVIAYMETELPDSENVETTKEWAASHLEEIRNVALDTLRENQNEDDVTVEVVNCYFPDKTYGDLTFPRGNYDALRIKIGEAKGKNWWCVLYPNLCFLDAVHAVVPDEGKEELKQVLDEEEYEMITVMSKFKVKWFFFEF